MLSEAYTLARAPSGAAQDVHLSDGRYKVAAAWCMGLALCAAALTAWFIVLGVEATEPASPARTGKVAVGVFLILVELSAFGMAAWLPQRSMRGSRVLLIALGVAVVVFDVALMSVSQVAIGMSAKRLGSASDGQAQMLRESIASKRQTVAALRESAAGQARSRFADARRDGSESLRRAEEVERQADAQAAELAALESSALGSSTTVLDVVGERGLIAMSIVMSVLLTASGIVLMHVAGGMLRTARGSGAVASEGAAASGIVPGGLPFGAKVVPTPSSSGRFAVAAAAPLAAFAAVPSPVPAAPVPFPAAVPTAVPRAVPAAVPMSDQGVSTSTPPGVATMTPSAAAEEAPVGKAKAKRAPKSRVPRDGAVMDTGVGEHDGARYRRALEGVRAGQIRPSIDGLAAAVQASAPVARRYLAEMARAGVIERTESGAYRRVPSLRLV